MTARPPRETYSDSRRKHERRETDAIRCDLGDVVDLSASGIRLVCRGKLPYKDGECGTVTLRFAGGTLNLKGRVVWSRRSGFRTYEIGLCFLGLSPAVEHALESLACLGFIVRRDEEEQATSKRSGPKLRAPGLRPGSLPNYYKILGVERTADLDTIKSAYRRLARRYHPDVTKDDDGQAKFISIQTAYCVLSDEGERRNYDRRLAG